MTAIEIIEKHLEIERQHFNKIINSDGYSAIETNRQYHLINKLEQILQQIKEQENEINR